MGLIEQTLYGWLEPYTPNKIYIDKLVSALKEKGLKVNPISKQTKVIMNLLIEQQAMLTLAFILYNGNIPEKLVQSI